MQKVFTLDDLRNYTPTVCAEWGHWRYRKSNNTLVRIEQGREVYEIDLNKIHDAREALDWLFHLARRYSAEDVGNLCIAFRDLFGFGLIHGEGK